ncbi:hypothetical protein WA158_004339 [Blastocystis sp. Blastoise]
MCLIIYIQILFYSTLFVFYIIILIIPVIIKKSPINTFLNGLFISYFSLYSKLNTLNRIEIKNRELNYYYHRYVNKQVNVSSSALPTLIVVIKTKRITERTVELSTLNSHNISRQQIFLIQTNSPQESYSIPYKSSICSDISFPYCIYTNHDQTDNFSFFLSIFYPSDYVLYIDEDQLQDEIKSKLTSIWLSNTINSIQKNKITLFSCSSLVYNDTNIESIQISTCLLTRQRLIRKILSYTSINQKLMSIMYFIPYFFHIENKKMIYDSFVIYRKEMLITPPPLLPQLFTCKYNNENKNDHSLTLLLPVYKRSKSYTVLDFIKKQTKVPDIIIILQNLHYIELPIDTFLNITIPTYYIWCSNWNSKFHMKIFLASTFTTTFAMTTDDDYYIDDKNTIENMIYNVSKKESIYGIDGGMNMKRKNGQRYMKTLIENNIIDHAAYIVFFRPRMSKIVMRYQQPTYYTGEDIGLGAINYLECNTLSYRKWFRYHDHTNDEFQTHNQKDEIFNYISYKNITLPDFNNILYKMNYDQIYNYYTNIGYRSYFYRITNETVNFIRDGKFCVEY